MKKRSTILAMALIGVVAFSGCQDQEKLENTIYTKIDNKYGPIINDKVNTMINGKVKAMINGKVKAMINDKISDKVEKKLQGEIIIDQNVKNATALLINEVSNLKNEVSKHKEKTDNLKDRISIQENKNKKLLDEINELKNNISNEAEKQDNINKSLDEKYKTLEDNQSISTNINLNGQNIQSVANYVDKTYISYSKNYENSNFFRVDTYMANVREFGDTESIIVNVYNKNDILEIVNNDTDSKWIEVRYNKNTGFISKAVGSMLNENEKKDFLQALKENKQNIFDIQNGSILIDKEFTDE
jgi:uncharacterized protein YigA (DUF484 family)